MRKFVSIIFGGVLLFLAASLSQAATYNFQQCGYEENACMSILVSGSDANGDGQLVCFGGGGPGRASGSWSLNDTSGDSIQEDDECSSISMSISFSGNSAVDATTFGSDDIWGFVVDLDSGFLQIGDDETGLIEGIGATNASYTYLTGPGPLQLCDGVAICGAIFAGDFTDWDEEPEPLTSTTEMAGGVAPAISTPTVPLPGLLLLGGLLAAIGYRRIKN